MTTHTRTTCPLRTIRVAGRTAVVTAAAARRFEAAGVSFAYLSTVRRNGRPVVVTVPVN